MLHWKIGETTITSVIESESITSPRFLFKGMDKAAVLAIVERSPWLAGNFVDEQGYLLQKIQCLVIEADGKRIAVDTCIGNDKARSNPGWNQLHGPFLTDLAAAGFPPDSIDYVICTHLHVDHVGWNTTLVDGRWVPTFPNARYLFARPELEYWRSAPDDFGDDTYGDSVAPIVEADLADLVDVTHQVCPSVRFEPTHGHTPGHISVVIESGGQRAVITGDMIHTPVQIAEVELSSSFDYDQEASRATRRSFLSRWSDGQTLIIGTHFGGPTAGQVAADGEDRWKMVL